jgi:hypothetical protein
MEIPAEIEPTWNLIHLNVLSLHLTWKMHEQLFKKEERINFLDHVAAAFFWLVQQSFLLEVQLGIAKLRDPAHQGQFSNMTVYKLDEEVRALYQEPLSASVQDFFTTLWEKLTAFKTASAAIHERRNKLLAHLDYEHALKRHPTPLPGPTRMEIENTLRALESLLNEIATHFGEMQTAYAGVRADGTAENVVGMMKAGMRYHELLMISAMEGDPHLSKWGNV